MQSQRKAPLERRSLSDLHGSCNAKENMILLNGHTVVVGSPTMNLFIVSPNEIRQLTMLVINVYVPEPNLFLNLHLLVAHLLFLLLYTKTIIRK